MVPVIGSRRELYNILKFFSAATAASSNDLNDPNEPNDLNDPNDPNDPNDLNIVSDKKPVSSPLK